MAMKNAHRKAREVSARVTPGNAARASPPKWLCVEDDPFFPSSRPPRPDYGNAGRSVAAKKQKKKRHEESNTRARAHARSVPPPTRRTV